MRSLWLVLGIASLCLAAGCGDDDSPGDTVKPTVVNTSPADGATDVNPYPIVEVWFSEAMSSETIDTLTIHVDGLPAHSVVYDAQAHRAVLYPATLAEAGAEYQVRVEAEVEDAAGNTMDQDVVFSFTTGQRDCAHLADRFEPNDAIASATPVETDVVYPGLTSCGGAERTDYYRFALSERRKVTVTTETAYIDTSHMSWEINFLRADGKAYGTLGTGTEEVGEIESYHYTFLPGTYWVGIGNYYATSRVLLYHLEIVTDQPVADDDYEDNDFPDQAAPIEPGLHENLRGAHVDADYFSIALAEGQTLAVTVAETPATTGIRRVKITNAAGASYVGDTYLEGPVTLSWTAAQTAVHLIEIQWWEDDIVYSLNVDVTP